MSALTWRSPEEEKNTSWPQRESPAGRRRKAGKRVFFIFYHPLVILFVFFCYTLNCFAKWTVTEIRVCHHKVSVESRSYKQLGQLNIAETDYVQLFLWVFKM